MLCAVMMTSLVWAALLTTLAMLTNASHLLNTTTQPVACNADGALEFKQSYYSKLAIAKEGQSKTLNCNANSYCHIQWYRNGVDPFPWSDMERNYVILENSNQSLTFNAASCEAVGNYTCIVANETHQIQRTIRLKVIIGSDWNKKPFPEPSRKCENQTACLGENVNFTCNFYTHDSSIGTLAMWYMQNSTGGDWVSVNESVYNQITPNKNRDCTSGQSFMLSTSLQLTVSSDDYYGLYFLRTRLLQHFTYVTLELTPGHCHLERKENQQAAWMVAVVIICVVLGVATAGKTMVSLPMQVWYKDVFGATEMNDGKCYDAYISYNYESEEERIFVTQTLRNHLMKNLGYSVCIPEINILPGTFLVEEIINALETSRRCILVTSPSYVTSVAASRELDIAIDRMSSCLSCVIPVVFQDITDEDMCQSNLLKYVMKSSLCIRWNPSDNGRFFKELQLRMPPKPKKKPANNLLRHEVLPGGFTAQLSQNDEKSMPKKKKTSFFQKNGVALEKFEVIDDSYPETKMDVTIV